MIEKQFITECIFFVTYESFGIFFCYLRIVCYSAQHKGKEYSLDFVFEKRLI